MDKLKTKVASGFAKWWDTTPEDANIATGEFERLNQQYAEVCAVLASVERELQASQETVQLFQESYEQMTTLSQQRLDEIETLRADLRNEREKVKSLQRELGAKDVETKALMSQAQDQLQRAERENKELLHKKDKEHDEQLHKEEEEHKARLDEARRLHGKVVGVSGAELRFREWLLRLNGWAGTGASCVVFDSTRDEAAPRSFFAAVRGRPNVAVVAVTAAGSVFGGFYAKPVVKAGRECKDPNVFVFAFAKNGACLEPGAFPARREVRDMVFVKLFSDGDLFVWFGGRSGGVSFGMEKARSFSTNAGAVFDGATDVGLTGQRFSCIMGSHLQVVRVVAFQLH